MTDQTEKFETWAVVEVMGHRKYAGLVTEQTLGGTSFVRVDVPQVGERLPFTKLLGSQSIYCITPCSEQAARNVAEQLWEKPITIYAPTIQPALEFDADDDFAPEL